MSTEDPARLTLRELTVKNGELAPASVTFGPGLNLIVGASDTGKTFVFETIDFMLGAKDGLRRFRESAGYESVLLSIDPSHGTPFTLRRAISGGEFEIHEFGDGRDKDPTATRNLSFVHSNDPEKSLSAYLLKLIGIGERQIRKNAQGEKKALSFRHVSRLTLVDEERIIQQASPLLSEHDTEHTAEENVFAYFLSGSDDSAIIPQENSKQRKARLATEADLLESLLAERTQELAQLSVDPSELTIQASKLESAIATATETVVATQAQITFLEQRRTTLTEERTQRESRSLFLSEQLKRLNLLNQYYVTDLARIEAVIEAAASFHELPEGSCPLCNQPIQNQSESSHEEFDVACRREMEKIAQLQLELGQAIGDFERELRSVGNRIVILQNSLFDLNNDLQSALMPKTKAVQSDLQLLMQTRTTVAKATTVQTAISGLQERLSVVRAAQETRVPKPVFESRASTSSATEFCQVVRDLLEEWKYPGLGEVAFDTEKCDLVIAGDDRANKGKGYRAITHAAFAIGLMRYCRQKAIPHPGIVVLDTPLNPYKGPVTALPGETVADVVKTAFFESLANDSSGDQIIIMENEIPDQSIQKRVHYTEFTRNPDIGRFGFFPVAKSELPTAESTASSPE